MKSGAGRPACADKRVPIQGTVPKSLYDAVDKAVAKSGLNRSRWMEEALRAKLGGKVALKTSWAQI